MSNFTKSTFTTCDYRDNDKCPPWELTASEIRHDNLNKTVYYDNAVIRIYIRRIKAAGVFRVTTMTTEPFKNFTRNRSW